MADDRTPEELACAAVAEAVFYHVSDISHRARLECALGELFNLIESRLSELIVTIGGDISQIQQRVEGLEKDSHPPVPLRPLIIEEVQAAIQRQALRGIR